MFCLGNIHPTKNFSLIWIPKPIKDPYTALLIKSQKKVQIWFRRCAVCTHIKKDWLKDRLIDKILFYVPLKNIASTWSRHHCQCRAAKFRSMLDTYALRTGRDFYRAWPAVTRSLGLSGLIRRTVPYLFNLLTYSNRFPYRTIEEIRIQNYSNLL